MTDPKLITREFVLTRAPGDAFDPAARTIPVIASTEAVDSYDEVIDQTSWKLGRFLAAPHALWQHCQWEDPIGFCRNVRVENAALKADLVLYEGKADPLGRAEQVLARYAQGGPVSVSVGFWCGRTETEERNGQKVRVLYDNDLHEISVVTIGANPDAVALRARSALRRARKGMMTFTEYLKERGMTPAQCATASGLTEEVVNTLVAGTAPTAEQCTALATGLGLTEDEVMAMFPKAAPAEGEGEGGGEGEGAVVVIEDSAKQLAELHELLGTKGDHGAARARVKALLHVATRAKETEAERRSMAAARDAREVSDLMAKAKADGRVAKVNEAKVAEHLKGASPSAVRAYLDTLVPLVDVTERKAPADVGTTELAVQLGARAGFTPEQLAKAAAENDRRRALRERR